MTCPSCGAALADDQRYCLNCGQRQGEPRVDFRQHLEAKDATAKPPAPAAAGAGAAPGSAEPPPQKPQRDYAPLAAAGGIAVLGIMLLIGVLIGRGTGDSNDSAAPPQVVTVGAAPAAGGAKEAESSNDTGQSKKKGSGGKSAKKKNASSEKTDTGNAPVASDSQLEALQGKTGQEYAEESAKLPDEIATPGEAPPTDSKAPGGGSGGVTLE
jgi:hypothetical protein